MKVLNCKEEIDGTDILIPVAAIQGVTRRETGGTVIFTAGFVWRVKENYDLIKSALEQVVING